MRNPLSHQGGGRTLTPLTLNMNATTDKPTDRRRLAPHHAEVADWSSVVTGGDYVEVRTEAGWTVVRVSDVAVGEDAQRMALITLNPLDHQEGGGQGQSQGQGQGGGGGGGGGATPSQQWVLLNDPSAWHDPYIAPCNTHLRFRSVNNHTPLLYSLITTKLTPN